MDSRARLTPVDVAWYGVAVFVFGLLAIPIYTSLNANAGVLGTGDAYMLRAIIPAALVTVCVLIMATAVEGR